MTIDMIILIIIVLVIMVNQSFDSNRPKAF